MAILPGGNDAYALLSIIADPDSAKKRLDELEAAHAAVSATAAESAAAAKSAADNRAATEAARDELRTKLAAQAADLASREAEVAKREAELDELVAAQRSRENEFASASAAKQAEQDKREADVAAREQAIAADNAAAAVALNSAQDLQKQWEAKMAKIKALQDD